MNLQNMPEVKMGIVAVSRDCFPMTLSENRRKAVVAAYKGEIYECPTVVESEVDMQKALKELREAGCNALVVSRHPDHYSHELRYDEEQHP